MDPIQLKTAIICIKARQRKMIHDFFARFYTPFSFIVWFFVGMDVDTCQNIPAIIMIIAGSAALFNAYHTFNQWKTDIKLITSNQTPTYKISGVIFFTDFIIHLICICLSFWWIDDLHTCIVFEKHQQFYIWFSFFVISMVLHVMQYNISQRRIDKITRESYKHVQSSSESV